VVLSGGKETSSHVLLASKAFNIADCQLWSTKASLVDLEIDPESKEDNKEK